MEQCSKSGTEFPIRDARLLKYSESSFHIILPSLSSLSRSEIFLNFEKRASFLGNPVDEMIIFGFLLGHHLSLRNKRKKVLGIHTHIIRH